MRPDVALVAPYPSTARPSTSGVAWYAQRLAHALTDAGATVQVIAPDDGGGRRTDRDGKVRVSRCFRRGTAGPLRGAWAAFRAGAPVTHVQHETFLYGGPASLPALPAALGALRAARQGPVVTMHQVVDPATVDQQFVDLQRVGVPAGAARAGLQGLQETVRRLSQATIVHEARFAEVVPGATVVPLAPNHGRAVVPNEAAALRRAHGLPDDAFVVLCFGFVAPYKGLEVVLDAATLAGDGVRVVVAGAEHPRLAGQGYLDGLADRFERVAHFTGYVPDREVPAWFGAADLVALAYPHAFSSSGVLVLAALHGTPAVLSPALAAATGAPQLAVPLDPPALAARFRQLVADPGQLAALATTVRQLMAGRSWPRVAADHLQIYEEVIHAQRGARRGHSSPRPGR